MAFIYFKDVEFHYEGTHLNIFEHLNLEIDTCWKTGIVAKNGRGKSTLLKLIQGELQATRGDIQSELETSLFPMPIPNKTETVLNVIKTCIGPLRHYECVMEDYMQGNVSEQQYLEALQHYIELGGYELDYLIEKEFNSIGLSPDLLSRSYDTLSGGEQTKVQIVALFLKPNTFVLLDEPTNHLDLMGVEILGNYLNKKDGFIVVSHHRDFLDQCIDHVISIAKAGIVIEQGNYSSWEYNYDLKKEFEATKRERIETDIRRLEKTAAQKRNWSNTKEKQKIGAGDKGYIGHKAAKLMKRALTVENRLDKQIEEKKSLIKYRERTPNIKFGQLDNIEKLLDVTHLTVGYDETVIIDDLTFSVKRGDRLAITGPNGCGKSTLIKALLREIPMIDGIIRQDNRVTISYSGQFPRLSQGLLRHYILDHQIDEARFRSIIGALCCHREIFERDLSTFSLGELKKVDLAFCLYDNAHLYIWDEPLNGLDIESRRHIEEAILKYEPTLLFVEHDAVFVDAIATDKIEL